MDESLLKIVDSPQHHLPLIIWEVDTHGILVQARGQGLELFHLGPNYGRGLNVLKDYAAYTPIVDGLRSALNGESVAFEVWMLQHCYKTIMGPKLDSNQAICGAIAITLDITDSKIIHNELDSATKRHQRTLDLYSGVAHSLAEGVCLFNQNGKLTFINPALSELLKIEVDFTSFSDLLNYCEDVEKKIQLQQSYSVALQTQSHFKMELFLTATDNKKISAQASIASILDQANTIIGAVVLITDVSAIFEQKKRISNLYLELSHRVKNTFQVIQSLISLMSIEAQTKESKQILTDLEHRIVALSLAQNQLQQVDNSSAIPPCTYLQNLIDTFKFSFTYQNLFSINCIQPKLHDDNLILPSPVLSSIGFILTELLMNTLKASNQSTPLTATITVVTDEKFFNLFYFDNGVFFELHHSETNEQGIGTTLLKSFTEHINSRLEFVDENTLHQAHDQIRQEIATTMKPRRVYRLRVPLNK
ncbi:MAG: PAS domain-containing protein [Oligoflexales bacterium]|nr:PAS domain-containing protein [Oligoflexales bacterium]